MAVERDEKPTDDEPWFEDTYRHPPRRPWDHGAIFDDGEPWPGEYAEEDEQ